MTRLYFSILWLAWFALMCFPARAETTTSRAIAALCGPQHVHLAHHVDAAARRYLLDRVLLVAVMARESSCRMAKVGAHHERCAMQIHGVARNGHSNRELADPATCIDTGARWLALREVDCRALGALAIGGYNARECRHGRKYARKVRETVERAWREMRRQREGRS